MNSTCWCQHYQGNTYVVLITPKYRSLMIYQGAPALQPGQEVTFRHWRRVES